MNLFYSVSDTQLTLWWDQAAQAGARYTVLLNDEKYSIDFQQKVTLKAGKTVHCKDIVGEKNA